MKKFFEKIMGSYSDRELKRIVPIVDEIESYENPNLLLKRLKLDGMFLLMMDQRNN